MPEQKKRKRFTVRDVKSFCGWKKLEMLVKAGHFPRERALVTCAFLTGGRIAEVRLLQRKHFDLEKDDAYIIVRDMPRVKSYKKIKEMVKFRCVSHCHKRWDYQPAPMQFLYHGDIEQYVGWLTRPVKEYRTFPINREEPIVPVLTSYLERFDDDPEALLFPIKYQTAYWICRRLGGRVGLHTPPHWFRAQRASQLAYDYGFTEHDLIEFFGWRDYATAFHYARKGYKGLARKMIAPKKV